MCNLNICIYILSVDYSIEILAAEIFFPKESKQIILIPKMSWVKYSPLDRNHINISSFVYDWNPLATYQSTLWLCFQVQLDETKTWQHTNITNTQNTTQHCMPETRPRFHSHFIIWLYIVLSFKCSSRVAKIKIPSVLSVAMCVWSARDVLYALLSVAMCVWSARDVLYALLSVAMCVLSAHDVLYALLSVAMCVRSARDVLYTLLSVAMCVWSVRDVLYALLSVAMCACDLRLMYCTRYSL